MDGKTMIIYTLSFLNHSNWKGRVTLLFTCGDVVLDPEAPEVGGCVSGEDHQYIWTSILCDSGLLHSTERGQDWVRSAGSYREKSTSVWREQKSSLNSKLF